MRVHVGTSGYNYPEWRGTFYPEGFPAGEDVRVLCRAVPDRGDQLHVLPDADDEDDGRVARSGAGGVYVHAEGSAAHHARAEVEGLRRHRSSSSARPRAVSEAHLATLLFQLPPTFKCDLPRLQEFLALLPTDLRAAFEFRHDSWLTDDVYRCARPPASVALCIADFGDKTTPVRADGAARLLPAARRGLHACRSRRVGRTSSRRSRRPGTTCSCTSSTRRKGRGRSSRARSSERLAGYGLTLTGTPARNSTAVASAQ